MITAEHAASLKLRAIPCHIAIAAGISSAQAPEVASVLGIQRADSGAMLIQYMQPSGEPVTGDDGLPLVRVRVDDGAPRYQSSPNAGFSVYLPPLLRAQISATTEEAPKLAAEWVAITEGEFKALSVEHNLGIACVGLPGVTMYRDPSRDKSEPVTASTPLHPDLAAVVARARGVVVIADSDAAENALVKAAMLGLCEAISKQFQIPCAYVQVPGAKKSAGRPKKDALGQDIKAPKLGIDDWIAQAGTQGADGIRAYLKKGFSTEVERIKALEEGGYIALGHTVDENTGAGEYFVYSIQSQAVVRILSGDLSNVNQLMHVCGMAWLKARYPKTSKGGEVSIDNLTAGGDLQRACSEAGFWVAERKVGAGVWAIPGDRTAIAVNSSAGLWASDDREMSRVEPVKGGRVYMSTVDLGVTPETIPATKEQAAEVLAALSTWTWSDPRDAGMAMGHLSASYLCGALDVRPMMYLTGRPGSGKSTLLGFLNTIEGPLALPVQQGTGTTEPAMRRLMGSSSMAAQIDEAEATDNPGRLNAIIAWLRSSYSGGTTSKASGSGGGVDVYTVRAMVALAAINPLRLDDSEQSRFIRLQLEHRLTGVESHELVRSPAEARELYPRLASRMIRGWPRYTAALEIAQGLLAGDGASRRYQDTLGTVIAAGWTMLHDGMPNAEGVQKYMDTMDIASQRERIIDTRSDVTPLEWLLDKIATLDVMGRTVRLSVRELVIQAGDEAGGPRGRSSPNSDAIGRLGLRIGVNEDGVRTLYVDPSRGELVELYRGSRWEGQDLEAAFKSSVPGCGRRREPTAMTIGGKKVKPLAMPLGGLVCIDGDDAPSIAGVAGPSILGPIIEQINTVYAQ